MTRSIHTLPNCPAVSSSAYHMTMLVVTHEMLFAKEVANRLIFMDQGVVIEDGQPAATLSDPKTERLRSFLRRFEQIL